VKTVSFVNHVESVGDVPLSVIQIHNFNVK